MRILHTADWHLGKKTHGKNISGQQMNQRLLDVRNRVQEVAVTARSESVDLVLFAGDAFEHPTPSPTQQRMLFDVVKDIASYCPIIMVPGNHDHPISEGRNHAVDLFREIGNVTVYDKPQTARWGKESASGAIVEYPDQASQEIMICAMPWPVEHFAEDNLQKHYQNVMQKAKKQAGHIPVIGVGHLTVNGAVPGGSESSSMGREVRFHPDDFEGLDYVALGHVHKHQDTGSSTPVVYASSPERLSFGEEGEKKGVVLFNSHEPEQWEFIEMDARPYVTIEKDLRDPPEELTATQWLKRMIDHRDVESAVVRVKYCADTTVNESEVFDALSDAYLVSSIEREQEETERQERSSDVQADAPTAELIEEFSDTKDLSQTQTVRMKEMLKDLNGS